MDDVTRGAEWSEHRVPLPDATRELGSLLLSTTVLHQHHHGSITFLLHFAARSGWLYTQDDRGARSREALENLISPLKSLIELIVFSLIYHRDVYEIADDAAEESSMAGMR